jgi:hypothetical protein
MIEESDSETRVTGPRDLASERRDRATSDESESRSDVSESMSDVSEEIAREALEAVLRVFLDLSFVKISWKLSKNLSGIAPSKVEIRKL